MATSVAEARKAVGNDHYRNFTQAFTSDSKKAHLRKVTVNPALLE